MALTSTATREARVTGRPKTRAQDETSSSSELSGGFHGRLSFLTSNSFFFLRISNTVLYSLSQQRPGSCLLLLMYSFNNLI